RWRTHAHRRAPEILACRVRNAPPAHGLAHNQIPRPVARPRIERVGAGRNVERAEAQRLVGDDRRLLVGARAPLLAPPVERVQGAPLDRRTTVGDRNVRAVDGPLGLDVRIRSLARDVGSLLSLEAQRAYGQQCCRRHRYSSHESYSSLRGDVIELWNDTACASARADAGNAAVGEACRDRSTAPAPPDEASMKASGAFSSAA